MKSLKEFIAENLENPTIIPVQENTGKTNENQDENDTNKTNENNENILKGQPNDEKTG
ncbi:hypothetical protein J3D55_003760 [Chryseobacterium ginsenosidimutans]|uniref:hypothetical protein n=1 Tax=Chryseobacterium ginsenosidimutans TaxID=687846 RepID=UPI0021675EFE|nr:hypothetical protein [Chryseobacterium ginsenosidimutans]MCS3870844.1 hypothetical protein [Chryseobacterium ginsenosidimutans]